MSSTPASAVRMTRTGRRVVPTPAAAAAAADKAASDKEKEAKTTPTSSPVAHPVTTPVAKSVAEKGVVPPPSRMSSRMAAAAKFVKPDEAVKESPKSATTTTPGKEQTSPQTTKPKLDDSSVGEASKRRIVTTTPTVSRVAGKGANRSTVRVSSGSNDESVSEPTMPVAKRAKISEPIIEIQQETSPLEKTIPRSKTIHIEQQQEQHEEEETQVLHVIHKPEPMETHDIIDDSQIFEAVAKMNAEADLANSAAVRVVEQEQQRSAVDSILADTTISVVHAAEVAEYEVEEAAQQVTQVVEVVNPPWNEQGCIICNVDITINDPSNSVTKSEQLKDFFLEFFSVGDQISLEDENTFPFCQKCAEEMDGLLVVSQNIESMHKQFNKVRDSMARKAIKTFLTRTKPNCLEEDAKAENYGFLDEEQKKSYKDQMFQLWKSRYELVQPGPKTPIMIRSMDSRGRVTVVRLNSHGQAVPDKFGGVRGVVRPTEVPLGGMGRLLTNGGEDDEESGNGMGGGTTLEIYQCKDCPKAFSAKSMLAYHARVHTGELPYECDQCGKAFSVPDYLLTHMKTHSGEKPYKCSECGKGFAQRGGLVTHSLVHTGAKPFSCQICGKSFRQKYHLTQHNLIHSGVKPFSCDLCGKAFNVKMNLREHMRRHTGDRPYKCPYCTTVGFFRKKMLKEHIIKAHPQRAMPEELMGPEPSTSYAAHDEEDEEMEDVEDESEEIIPEIDEEEEGEVAA